MADQNKLCAITNNSGQDAVVMSVVTGENVGPGAIVSFNQQLAILKTSSGNTVIKNGSSDTVTLDQTFTTNAGETQYVMSYDLIIGESNWLYPLANHLIVMQELISGLYDPQTVNGTDAAAMSQAFNFYQTIDAYPASSLAAAYTATLQEAQSSTSSPSAYADMVDSFFKGTVDYKNVTFEDMLAAEKYYNDFPCVWAQYQDSITYYLYGKEGTAVIFVGTLSLNKSGAVDITKPNSGYTCSFSPAANPSDTSKADVDTSKAVNLTYNNRAFTGDTNSLAPQIALEGNFQLKRVFTGKSGDTAIIPAFKGTANGLACTGINVPMYQY